MIVIINGFVVFFTFIFSCFIWLFSLLGNIIKLIGIIIIGIVRAIIFFIINIIGGIYNLIIVIFKLKERGLEMHKWIKLIPEKKEAQQVQNGVKESK